MTVNAPAVDQVRRRQEAFYDDAEAQRFEWLTEHPLVRRAEQALLATLGGLADAPSILEVGCGEGANFATLRKSGRRFRYTGFDCFPAKVAFCRQRHRDGRFLMADARQAFPFLDRAFDRVLVRDLLHHLAAPDREQVLRESMRVLAPGGRLWIVEGNAANALGRGFALLFPHERCMLETRAPRLQQFVAATLPGYEIVEAMAEPSNAFRLVCHYRFGVPALGRTGLAGALMRVWTSAARVLRPSARWAYSIVEVRKPAEHGTAAAKSSPA